MAPTTSIAAITWPAPAPEYQAGRTEVVAYMLNAGWSHADLAIGLAIAEAESSLNIAAVSPPAFDNSRGYGLWQIEYPTHKDLFDQLPEPGLANGDWISIHENALMALKIRQSQGWHAWTTYTTGAYVPFLIAANAAVQAVDLITADLAKSGGLNQKHPDVSSNVSMNVVTQKTAGEEISLIFRWRETVTFTGVTQTATGAIADTSSAAGPALGDAFGAANAIVKPFSSVLDFLNKLGDAQFWIRVVEVVIGGALVIVALNTFAKPVTEPVIQTVAKAGKAVAK